MEKTINPVAKRAAIITISTKILKKHEFHATRHCEGGVTTVAGSYGGILIDNNKTTAASANGGALAVSNNSAITTGGALNAQKSLMISGSYNGVSFVDNTANNQGGAVYSGGNIIINPTSAGDITISGNIASGGSTANGGAFYGAGSVTVPPSSGTMSFASNMAANGSGGAIYAVKNVTVTAAGATDFTSNIHGDPAANAIWFNNTAGGATATFNADSRRVITFFDPVMNNQANGLMSVSKTGGGMVSFDGLRVGTDAERWSKMFANTNVSAGIFEVANNAVYGALSTDAATPTATTGVSPAGHLTLNIIIAD